MSEADIQALVESVASQLGAAVGLTDTEERLIAHSAHEDAVIDEVRRAGIMHRRLTPEVRSWFEQWGYRESSGPVRTPADEALGILERWCVPVVFHTTNLAYMWLIDAGKLREEDLGPAMEAADQIALLLYRRRLVKQADADLLRLLLIPNSENENAASDARTIGTYTHTGPIAVVVAGPAGDDSPDPETNSVVAATIQRAVEQASPPDVLSDVISGLGVLLAPLRNPDDLTPARVLAEKVLRLVAHMSPDLEMLAAIGGAAELERASHSFTQARRTLNAVSAMPDLGPIASWDELGVFRALVLVAPSEAENGAIDPRIRQLLNDAPLAETAETFLDLAGNVQKTAARLFVHRTTLYQRLDRITELYKLDLRRSGDDRLIAHLGFKLARVARS